LGTRRLRLSVVAYLRGLLEPYYNKGLLSLVRENLVLEAIDKELASDAIKHASMLDASIMPIHKNQSGLYERMYDKMHQSRMMNEMSIYKSKKKAPEVNSDKSDGSSLSVDQRDIVDKFKLLQDTGVWGQIEDYVRSVKK